MAATIADLIAKVDQVEVRVRAVENVSANVKLVGIIVSIVFSALFTFSLGAVGYLIFTLGELKEAKLNAITTSKEAKERHDADVARLEKHQAAESARFDKANDRVVEFVLKSRLIGSSAYDATIIEASATQLVVEKRSSCCRIHGSLVTANCSSQVI